MKIILKYWSVSPLLWRGGGEVLFFLGKKAKAFFAELKHSFEQLHWQSLSAEGGHF
jgi:hypothetical protein